MKRKVMPRPGKKIHVLNHYCVEPSGEIQQVVEEAPSAMGDAEESFGSSIQILEGNLAHIRPINETVRPFQCLATTERSSENPGPSGVQDKFNPYEYLTDEEAEVSSLDSQGQNEQKPYEKYMNELWGMAKKSKTITSKTSEQRAILLKQVQKHQKKIQKIEKNIAKLDQILSYSTKIQKIFE